MILVPSTLLYMYIYIYTFFFKLQMILRNHVSSFIQFALRMWVSLSEWSIQSAFIEV